MKGWAKVGLGSILLLLQLSPVQPATNQAEVWGQLVGRLLALTLILWLLISGGKDIRKKQQPK